MRIAIYHHLHSGGAKRVVEMQQAYLAARGHQIVVYSLEGSAHASDPNATSATTRSLPYRPLPLARRPFGRLNPIVRTIDVLRLQAVSRDIAQVIDQEGFDVILAHPCQVTQAPLVLRTLRTPALYYCHELPRQHYEPRPYRAYYRRSRLAETANQFDPFPKFHGALIRIVDRQSAQRARMIAVNSRFSQSNVLAAYGLPARVCYPGVDSRAFIPARDRRREAVVLSVGALTPLKGFDFIIESLATLPLERRPRLLIISNYQEAMERAYLEALAAERQVRLEIRVAVAEAELQAAYAMAGCVAYTPLREPFGLVALEAMAAGTPLVAVAEGGVAETVIHGETGLLAPRVPALFGRAVEELLAAPARAEALGQQAREHVSSTWTWERHISNLEHLLVATAGGE